jgi:hypothetical protein
VGEGAIKLLEAGINPSAANTTLGVYAQCWFEEDIEPPTKQNGNQNAGVAETTFAN